MFTKYHWMGGALGIATGPNSVAFFLKTKPKEEKVFFYFPQNVAYFDLVLHSRFKTKRSLRSDIDRQINRQNNRLTDKMTTVNLWRMRTEG